MGSEFLPALFLVSHLSYLQQISWHGLQGRLKIIATYLKILICATYFLLYTLTPKSINSQYFTVLFLLINESFFFFFPRWMRSQELDVLHETVCWSFSIGPCRSVLCFCLHCARIPCFLICFNLRAISQ